MFKILLKALKPWVLPAFLTGGSVFGIMCWILGGVPEPELSQWALFAFGLILVGGPTLWYGILGKRIK
jgi:hypothetical protein